MSRFGNILILLLVATNSVYTKRIKDMIYMSIDGAAACFRRHNGTHQFGCSSSRSGNVGVIHFVENSDDVEWLKESAQAGPYAVVLPFSMFTREILIDLRDSENVNGILLARNTSVALPLDYSPEDTCPNRYSGFKGCNNEKPWNRVGSSLLMEDWPFPIFYLQNNLLLEEIQKCFYKHNAHNMDKQAERSLCALEMKAFMHAAINSESCIRRSTWLWNFNPSDFCHPLGDRNIHWPLGPLTDKTKSVILVTARLDTNSMFDGLAPGANSAVAGFVTLLATAYYLNSLNATVEDTNVIFSFLNGEAFDYIGSGRMVYNLKEGTFNAIGGRTLSLDKITTMIELGQLGGFDKLYLHATNFEGDPLIAELQKSLSLENSTLKDSVPPASIQSFLTANPNLTAVVLSNYEEQFTNKYYHSILDDASSLGFNGNGTNSLSKSLSDLAIKLGDVLYYNVTGKKSISTSHERVENLVEEMLFCYLINSNCSLFRAASFPGMTIEDRVLPLYVSVTRAPNDATSYTGQLLVLLTGTKLPNMTASQCSEHRYSWMGGENFTGVCINSTVNYTAAISPVFTNLVSDMKSRQYSTWTESVWSVLSVRMFLKPSAATGRLSITLGSVVTCISFLVVWFINSRAHLLFESRRAADC